MLYMIKMENLTNRIDVRNNINQAQPEANKHYIVSYILNIIFLNIYVRRVRNEKDQLK